ncbi:MAG: DNA/RNA non-specific endonuclease [Pseudomonadales bacterium]|nr:DNA/RNA non-specific endonuclease [Pseudomonadales bacterium]
MSDSLTVFIQYLRVVARLMRWGSVTVVICIAASTSAQKIHISHCMGSCPDSPATANNEIVVRHLFAASINADSGLADWVAYRVVEAALGVASLLPRVWQVDNLLLTESPYLRLAENTRVINQPDLNGRADQSYRINELSIDARNNGRLVPMSSFAGTPFWSDLNYLSNLAALPSALREGSWSRLDQAINELAARSGELFVVSGPLYLIQEPLNVRGRPELVLPSAYYKLIANQGSYVAFIFNKDLPQRAHYCDQLSSLLEVQQLSGLQLFPDMQDSATTELAAALHCTSYRDF